MLKDVRAEVHKYVDIANKLYPACKLPYPEVVINARLKTTAGRAFSMYKVDFSKDLLERHYSEMIQDTIPHEVAHLVVSKMWPNETAHGNAWKDVMRAFNTVPQRTHNMRNSKVITVEYTCNCSTHYLSSRMHKNILAGKSNRVCNTCKGRLQKVV